jgi:threonyl-tRNA synthetase
VGAAAEIAPGGLAVAGDVVVDRELAGADLRRRALGGVRERIVRENQRFVRRVVTEDEARAEMADEPFKLELRSRR